MDGREGQGRGKVKGRRGEGRGGEGSIVRGRERKRTFERSPVPNLLLHH